MHKYPSEKKDGINFTAIDLGSLSDLDNYTFKHPALSQEIKGKVFLKQLLGLTSSEISLNKMPAGASMPFLHKHHRNEEIYIFLKGYGEFQIDEQVLTVKEGTVIRIAPEGVRWWRNNSDEDMYYIVFQAPAGFCKSHTIQDGLKINKS